MAITPTLGAFDGELLPGSLKVRHGHGSVVDLEYSADGSQLALASNRGVFLYRLDTFEQVWQIEVEGWVNDLTWSPSGDRLALASKKGSIAIWSTESGEELINWPGHTGQVFVLDWSESLNRLASGGEDGLVRIWEGYSGELADELKVRIGPVVELRWSDDNRLLILSDDPLIWDPRTDDLTYPEVYYYEGPIASFSRSGDSIATGLASGKLSIEKRGNLEDYLEHELNAYDASVTHVEWSRDSRCLSSGYDDGRVIIWDGWTGEKRQVLNGHPGAITALSWSPSGNQIATGSQDGTMSLWPVEACAPIPGQGTTEARQTLIQYFDDLGRGNFSDASDLFGDYPRLRYMSGNEEAGEADLLQDMCQYLICMPIEEIISAERVSPTEYRFTVKFTDELLGYRVEGIEDMEFSYRVIFDCQGKYRVMDLPVYLG